MLRNSIYHRVIFKGKNLYNKDCLIDKVSLIEDKELDKDDLHLLDSVGITKVYDFLDNSFIFGFKRMYLETCNNRNIDHLSYDDKSKKCCYGDISIYAYESNGIYYDIITNKILNVEHIAFFEAINKKEDFDNIEKDISLANQHMKSYISLIDKISYSKEKEIPYVFQKKIAYK